MVADKVTIDTLSFHEDAASVRWTSEDGMRYEIDEGSRDLPGTTITLHLAEAEHEFLHEHTLRETLEKYCAFMAVPIFLGKGRAAHQRHKPAVAEKTRPTAPTRNTKRFIPRYSTILNRRFSMCI